MRLPLHLLAHPQPLSRLALLALAAVLLTATAAPAATVTYNWHADGELLALEGQADLDALLANHAWRTELAGRPELPLYPLGLAIPAGERVAALRLEDVIADRIVLDAPLAAFTGVENEHGERWSAGEDRGDRFPAEFLHAQSTQRYRGHATAAIALAPLLYVDDAQGPALLRLRGATVVVETEVDPGARIPLRQRREDLEFARRLTQAQVANRADATGFAPSSAIRSDDGLFQPRSLPSIEGSGVDMVIVCAAEHAAIMQELADFKLSVGLATVVRDLDWIQANYPQGADLAETIRFFLQDAYEQWGISYVLLAGDTGVVPARSVHSYFKDPPEDIPAELYYSQMDGNWNADGDQWFGESNYGGTDGDEVDMVADLHLGRMPVTDAESAQLMVDKVIAYTTAPNPDFCTAVSFFAEVLFPATWQITDPVEWITRNGADYAENVYDSYLPPDLDAVRYYETDWLFPGSQPLTVTGVLNDLNTRANIVHHVGHGFRYTMSVGDGSVTSSDILGLQNGFDKLFTMFALNCTSCAIDYNCLGESVLLAPEGGGIGVIGTMREAFPNTSLYYQNTFFSHLFADSLTLGECFTASRNQWASLGVIEGSHRWTQMSYVLIGDPSVNVWMGTPQALSVAVTEPYVLSSDTLAIAVTRDALPLAGATVIAHKAGEDRAQGVTDENGLLSLPFHAESEGELELSVLNRNDFPTFANYVVAAGGGPRLSVELLGIEDDPIADPSTLGNADGRLDAGETLRLGLRVHNRGGAGVTGLELALSLPGGELTVLESTVATGQSLAAGDSLDLSGAFLLSAPQSLGDGLNVLVDIDLTHDDGGESDQFDMPTRAPLPALFAFDIDDSAGDGDGEPDVGETYLWQPVWKNYGATPLDGWTAGLTAIDPAGQVLGGDVSLPVLGLLESGASNGIPLRENDLSAPNRFLLTLSGPLGESLSDTIVVRRPEAPAELFLDSSFASTIIDLAWEIPGAGGPAGYLVYRSETSGGPYALISSEPTRHAYFRSAGLAESTTYYFTVATVDSAGFLSAMSAEGSISTNPSMAEGWPLRTSLGTASSVVIGDIDGDGDKELVSGAERIYAWHHDGVEVLDGDADSATYGVLSDEGTNFVAAIAMADVDSLFPGDEIVAASSAPFNVYVYHGDGTVVDGWPKSLPNWCWGTPAVADVDGDGSVEIFAPCLDGKLYAWHADGSELIGGSGGVFLTGLGGWSNSSPTLADIDGDPELEVIIGSAVSKLFAVNHDGTPVPGFPVSFSGAIFSSASVGDLDGDYDMEMVFLCENDSLYVLEHDGSRRPGFPVPLNSNSAGLAPSAALVDFEDDGQLEIVCAGVYSYTSFNITVLDNAGNTLPGWPIHLEDSSEASPVVADLDGDDALEILLGTEKGFLYAWEQDGSDMPGFPILTQAELRSCPTIDDLDSDTDTEIALMGWDAFVYVWDMPGFYNNGLAHWKMFRANPARTGVFTREEQVVGVDDGPVAPPEGKLFANYPNPFNPSTRIRLATPAGEGKVAVTLTVHDIQGRRLRTLHEGDLSRGTVHSVVWDGKTDAGKPVASGVYFARVEMDATTFSRKMLLLK